MSLSILPINLKSSTFSRIHFQGQLNTALFLTHFQNMCNASPKKATVLAGGCKQRAKCAASCQWCQRAPPEPSSDKQLSPFLCFHSILPPPPPPPPFCLSVSRPFVRPSRLPGRTPLRPPPLGERGGVWPARRVLLFRDRHARQMCCCAAPKREFLFRKSCVKKRGGGKKERCVIHASSMRSSARQLFSDGGRRPRGLRPSPNDS